MYYEEENGTFLIYNHDKSNNSLPINGWLHNCLCCRTITSNYEDYYYGEKKLKILICSVCYKHYNKKEYQKKINNWIEKNIPKI